MFFTFFNLYKWYEIALSITIFYRICALEFPKFLLNFVSHRAWENFQICGVQNTGEYILRVKKLKGYIFIHVPQGNTLLKPLIVITQIEGSYSFPLPKQGFFEDLFNPISKKGEGGNYEGSVKLMIGSVIRCVNELRYSKFKKLPNSFLRFY